VETSNVTSNITSNISRNELEHNKPFKFRIFFMHGQNHIKLCNSFVLLRREEIETHRRME